MSAESLGQPGALRRTVSVTYFVAMKIKTIAFGFTTLEVAFHGPNRYVDYVEAFIYGSVWE
jgi:hypothetical protein